MLFDFNRLFMHGRALLIAFKKGFKHFKRFANMRFFPLGLKGRKRSKSEKKQIEPYLLLNGLFQGASCGRQQIVRLASRRF